MAEGDQLHYREKCESQRTSLAVQKKISSSNLHLLRISFNCPLLVTIEIRNKVISKTNQGSVRPQNGGKGLYSKESVDQAACTQGIQQYLWDRTLRVLDKGMQTIKHYKARTITTKKLYGYGSIPYEIKHPEKEPGKWCCLERILET